MPVQESNRQQAQGSDECHATPAAADDSATAFRQSCLEAQVADSHTCKHLATATRNLILSAGSGAAARQGRPAGRAGGQRPGRQRGWQGTCCRLTEAEVAYCQKCTGSGFPCRRLWSSGTARAGGQSCWRSATRPTARSARRRRQPTGLAAERHTPAAQRFRSLRAAAATGACPRKPITRSSSQVGGLCGPPARFMCKLVHEIGACVKGSAVPLLAAVFSFGARDWRLACDGRLATLTGSW